MVSFIGTAAAVLSTIAFLPQTIYVLRTKDTRSLSLPMYVLFFIGVVLWCVYGFMLKDFPLIASNGIVAILAFVILMYKIMNYKSDRDSQRGEVQRGRVKQY